MAASRGFRRFLRWVLFLLITGVVLAGGAAVALILYYGSDPDLPKFDRATDYHPKVVSKIMSADGELIGELYEERRTVVPRARISDAMIHAIVDAEDASFYEHKGLSYWGMARAFAYDLKPGSHKQGASTLTQQLVRNLILQNKTRSGLAAVKRKVQEMILSVRIETQLSKDEILALYLNQVQFPYQRYGVEEAARFYFGKSVADVDAGEAALLASLPKGPTEIDPLKHPDRAKERQRYVLSQMVRYGHLGQAEAEKLAAQPIKLVRSPSPFLGSAPEFVDEVRHALVEKFGLKQLPTLGLTVITTCDSRIQKLTREAVEKGLVDVDSRQGYRRPLAHLSGSSLKAHLAKLQRDLPSGPTMGKIVEGVVKGVNKASPDGLEIDLGARTGFLALPAAVDRYNPKGVTADKRFAVGDVIRVRMIDSAPLDGWNDDKVPLLALELGPQAAVMVMDPNTREVKAMVGGYGYQPGSFNRVTKARRQPGSSFKPFVYAAAFASEKWTPSSVLIDGPQTYATPGLAPWKPQNAEKEEFLGPVRLRVALARSLNTIASQLVDVERGGVEPGTVANLARDLGIESSLEANPSLALGTSVVSPFEMTNAYATIAAGGKRMEPQLIRQIGAEKLPEAAAAATQAIKPELAYLITNVMTSVIEEGTGVYARGRLRRPAAGKTGTTNLEHKRPDAWFIGFTPDLVTGVWVGFDDMRDLGKGEQGARAALPMWVEIMNGALKNVPPKPFAQPPGIVVQRIDPKSGLLAPPGSNGMEEVFLDGTAPTQVAPAAGEANPDTYIIDQAQAPEPEQQ